MIKAYFIEFNSSLDALERIKVLTEVGQTHANIYPFNTGINTMNSSTLM